MQRVRAKIDPAYLAAARELRDRWMERANAGMLIGAASCGKYDVSRALSPVASARLSLPAA